MSDFEEVNFSFEGKDYFAEIEVEKNNDWRVMRVCEFDEPEIWADMKIVPAKLTKVMVAAIEEFVSELDPPHVESDYDWKDLQYDQETP